MTLLSIIVPVHNGAINLFKLIKTLVPTIDLTQVEVIFVDDASSEFRVDDIVLPPFRVIRNEKNLGFAATCNRGAQEAKGQYILFLNSDIQLTPDWGPEMLNIFSKEKNVGIVGPKLIFPPTLVPAKFGQIDIGTEFEYVGEVYKKTSPTEAANEKIKAFVEYGVDVGVRKSIVQSCGGLFDLGKGPYHRYLGWDANDWRVNKTEKVSWITGAAMMMRLADFNKLRGFDEGFVRGYFEDVDLNMRMRFELGKDIWYAHKAVMVHTPGSSSTNLDSAKRTEAASSFRQNSFRFHKRWDEKIKPDSQTLFVPY